MVRLWRSRIAKGPLLPIFSPFLSLYPAVGQLVSALSKPIIGVNSGPPSVWVYHKMTITQIITVTLD
jgi:hypothetical protein